MAHYLATTAALLLLLLFTTVSATADTVSVQELEAMMEELRARGYTLFCNAISTSDLQLQLLSSSTTTSSPNVIFPNINGGIAANGSVNATGTQVDALFTIFAPQDPHLYALDMASDAAAYISTLRYHVSPNHRLTLSDLRNLSSPFLETLLPHYNILVSSNKSRLLNGTAPSNNYTAVAVRVDGVSISDPEIYVGSRIIVHGLDGILVTGIVKNEDLVDDTERPGSISAEPAAAPAVMAAGEEVIGQAAPPGLMAAAEEEIGHAAAPNYVIKAKPAPPVVANTGNGQKIKNQGKHPHHHSRRRHHNRHRRSRGTRRQRRSGDRPKDDL